MTAAASDAFAQACSELVGQIAVNPSLSEAVVEALASEKLTRASGPMGIDKVLKGLPGKDKLKRFLDAWRIHAPHLGADDVAASVKSGFACYRLAQGRAHAVDTVWTGPEVAGSEVRRTEAVVNEIVASAQQELLIVGYWLVAHTAQIRELIKNLRQKAEGGVNVRFVLDPGEKSKGADNFTALGEQWPAGLEEAPRSVFSWGEGLATATSKSGVEFDRKLHAKVIVADRRDALVTSANLTHAGLLVNLEMGLRIQGPMAAAVVRHFNLLIDEGTLEPR